MELHARRDHQHEDAVSEEPHRRNRRDDPRRLHAGNAERVHLGNLFYGRQASWSELCSVALDLYLMVDAETRVAEAAMARYNDKIKKLTKGTSSIGRVAGYAPNGTGNGRSSIA